MLCSLSRKGNLLMTKYENSFECHRYITLGGDSFQRDVDLLSKGHRPPFSINQKEKKVCVF